MWYVVAHPDALWKDAGPDDKVWTVSLNPDEPGWRTDGGCPGYGLTKPIAEFLVAAANEKIARDRERAFDSNLEAFRKAYAEFIATAAANEEAGKER